MLVTPDLWALRGSETETRSLGLELLCAVRVLAWSRHVQLTQLRLEFDAHGEARVLCLQRRGVLLVSAGAWSIQVGQALEFLAHQDAFLTKRAFADGVVAWRGNGLCHFVVVHFALRRTETVVRRSVLRKLVRWVVQARVRVQALCLRQARRIYPLGRSDAVIRSRFQRLEVEFILAWAWHKFVSFLLELVFILGTHCQLRAVFANDYLFSVGTRPWRVLVLRST